MTSMMTSKLITPDTLGAQFGWRGEGGSYLEDLTTGDIMVVNDFYGASTDPAYNPASKFNGMRQLEQIFPGTFTWRFIIFPRGEPARICRRDFHRGSCFQLIFKAKGTIEKTSTTWLRKESTKKRNRREMTETEQAVANAARKRTTL